MKNVLNNYQKDAAKEIRRLIALDKNTCAVFSSPLGPPKVSKEALEELKNRMQNYLETWVEGALQQIEAGSEEQWEKNYPED